MKPMLRCAKEWVGANLANQRCKAYILRDGRSFLKFAACQRRSGPPTEAANNKERRYGQAEMGSFHICSRVDRRWRGRVHDRPTGAESRLLFRRCFWIADICSWIVASYTNFVSKAEPLKIGDCEIQLGHCGSNRASTPRNTLSPINESFLVRAAIPAQPARNRR